MSKIYSPRIVTDSLVMCLDPSQNKSLPTDLPVKDNLALWLDASDDSTFSYSSGTSVSQWRDKSGNNRHFFQSTAGNQPSRSGVMNSRKVVQFTAASSQYLRYNSTIINNPSAASVFFVWRTAGETQGYANLLDNYHGGSNALSAGFSIERNNVSDQLYWGFYSSGFAQAGATGSVVYSNNTSYLYYLTKDSTIINAKANGYTVATLSSPSSTWVEDTKGWLIGCWGSNIETFSRFYNGQIAEILIFRKGLSTIEAKQVTAYLSLKWNTENIDKNIFDLSGFNGNGSLGNGVTANMPDYDYYNKGALAFNGTSDYAYQSLFNNTITTTLTFDVWVKFNDTGSSGRYIMSLGRDIGIPSGGLALLAYGFSSASSGQIIFEFGSGYGRVSSGIVPTTGIWYNLTVTADGTNTRFYVNSVLANTASQTTGAVTSSPGLSIGSYLNAAAPPTPGTPFFYGNIGSVKIYNKTLSQAEISQNYEAQKSKFANTIVQQGLVLNIDIDNPYSYAGAGTTVYDVSPTALTWTATNTTYNSSPIKYLSYNGSNSSLVSSTSTAYDSQTITMECWCYPNALAQSGFLFEKGAVNTQYSMFFNSDGNFIFRTMNTSNETVGITSSAYFVVSRWNHVVCTYNGSLKTIYVNGVQVSNLAASGALNTGGVNQYIGKYGALGDNYPFNGRIAESRVYNIALTAAQVLQNYNATRTKYGL